MHDVHFYASFHSHHWFDDGSLHSIVMDENVPSKKVTQNGKSALLWHTPPYMSKNAITWTYGYTIYFQ